ncbi:lig_chan-Glu_bd domain-containing protein [Caerostris extrusa]|uniref:Lig_chan-Glu_bd domain-containing protein n=1 Tax=Caerostris extrusa TaxID=172846 RepID=A0AAV4QLP2_CAEEX|nr:lig_chan-Glu_bd domain-containing protein [Caerostris extrusa]
MQQKITVVIKPMELLMHVNRMENGEVQLEGCDSKFLQIVLEALRKKKYEIIVTQDMLYYDPLPDGNFTGILGMVQRGEADLTITYMPTKEIHSKSIDFSVPYKQEQHFHYAQTGNIKSNLALLQVFDTTTWIGICIVLIVMSIVFAKFKGSVGTNLLKLLGIVVGQSSTIEIVHQGPTKVPPVRNFLELFRAVQSGNHKLHAMESHVPFFLESGEDHVKALGRMLIRENWVIEYKKYLDISYDIEKSSQVKNQQLRTIKIRTSRKRLYL